MLGSSHQLKVASDVAKLHAMSKYLLEFKSVYMEIVGLYIERGFRFCLQSVC